MVLIDSDVFVKNFFGNDPNYGANRVFLQKLGNIPACTTIFNFFEVLGKITDNLPRKEFQRYCLQFDDIFHVTVIYPRNKGITVEKYFDYLKEKLLEKMSQKMPFGDALILTTAEEYSVAVLITWNKKHFVSRTNIEVLTPEEFLQKDGFRQRLT